MTNKPKISVCIPIYDMKNIDAFLCRLMNSLAIQKFRDFEIVITKDGAMAENTNSAIKKAKGEIIKILYMDDYLAHENSLQEIVDNFKGGWLVTGCEHDTGSGKRFNPHYPTFRHNDVDNMIGSPSVLAFENKEPLLFDETMTWLLDYDLYKRLYVRYGPPIIVNGLNVVIGIGEHQATNLLSDELKLKEREYINKKYGNYN